MNITRKHLTFALIGILAVGAICALAGHPMVPPEWLAGISVLPFATGETAVVKQLEQLTDVAKAAKEAVETMRKAHNDLDGQVKKLHDELGVGKPDAITKAAFQDAVAKVDKAETALDKLKGEVTELAQKAANMLGSAQQKKSLGRQAAETDVAKNYRGGTVELGTFDSPLHAKAAITSAVGSAGLLVDPYRVPGILMEPETQLTVRDLFPTIGISSSSIEWLREKLFTNNAGPQNGEGTTKNESAWTFEKMQTPVSTLAHWIPASRQILADVPALAGLIDTKLRTGLKLKEDEQLLLGDGQNGNLLGLIPQATAYNPANIPAGATSIDHLRWAFLQVAKAKYPATFGVLSLDDWAIIQMMKTTDGAYIFGTPTDGTAPRIWGKRIVESYGLVPGEFVAGSGFAGTIYDREQVTVRVAEQHGNFFVQNMVAILCEERIAFTLERPAAIVAGQLPA
ncbi:phage major capsid protein [Xylophilus rhododendri]|uniref:Phage major capsid protein n=1 Tax=Xylophilus rhododendri TaxID=2697032 RepID=A0A857J9E8_9BURK|nr:phage major capsid protein [Xylophilus rhododendri]QHI99358.1 phage major capsid protein [Xylophilus rhododendri]